MIIVYLTFTVDPDRSEAFDRWFPTLVSRTHAHEGCIAYDHYVDPGRPDAHVLFEVWASVGEQAAHTRTPEHAEIINLGSERYGMRDLVVRRWTAAGDYTVVRRSLTTRPAANAGTRTSTGSRERRSSSSCDVEGSQ